MICYEQCRSYGAKISLYNVFYKHSAPTELKYFQNMLLLTDCSYGAKNS